MPDYSSLLKAELVSLLEQRDGRISALESQSTAKDSEINRLQQLSDTQSRNITNLRNGLSAAQNQVQQKDNEIRNLQNRIADLNNQISNRDNQPSSGASPDAGATTSAQGVISSILSLPDSQKDLLPSLTRTKSEGIMAHAVFNYGASTCLRFSSNLPTAPSVIPIDPINPNDQIS